MQGQLYLSGSICRVEWTSARYLGNLEMHYFRCRANLCEYPQGVNAKIDIFDVDG